MRQVGVYYHPSFSHKSYMTVGNRLRDFPEALDGVLKLPNVRLFESPGCRRSSSSRCMPRK